MPTSPKPVAPSENDAAVSHNAGERPPEDRDGGANPQVPPTEIGGRGGLEPTRFGDWEKNGRCIDF